MKYITQLDLQDILLEGFLASQPSISRYQFTL